MTYESIVKNIDEMPPLSNIIKNMQQLYSRGTANVNMKELIKLIEADAMLTANILKEINSPYYGFSRKISSISQAVMLFGITRIKAFVFQYAMSKQLTVDTEIYGFNNEQFNDMCILQSSLMMQWFAKVNLRDTDILMSLALIMESGKLIIAKELYASDYLEVYREGFLACDNIVVYEKEFFCTTSYYLSSVLFRHWNLEPMYADVLEAMDADEKRKQEFDAKIIMLSDALDVVRTAINLKEVLTDASINKAIIKVNRMGLDGAHFEKTALRVKKAYEQE